MTGEPQFLNLIIDPIRGCCVHRVLTVHKFIGSNNNSNSNQDIFSTVPFNNGKCRQLPVLNASSPLTPHQPIAYQQVSSRSDMVYVPRNTMDPPSYPYTVMQPEYGGYFPRTNQLPVQQIPTQSTYGGIPIQQPYSGVYINQPSQPYVVKPVDSVRNEKRRRSLTSRKNRSCSICNKVFNRPSGLKIHMHTHTGEKPFTCEWPNCNKRFSVRSNMLRHLKIHKREERKRNERKLYEEQQQEKKMKNKKKKKEGDHSNTTKKA